MVLGSRVSYLAEEIVVDPEDLTLQALVLEPEECDGRGAHQRDQLVVNAAERGFRLLLKLRVALRRSTHDFCLSGQRCSKSTGDWR